MIKRASVLLGGASVLPKTGLAASARYRMPEESEPHSRTWMAFVAREDIWSRRQVPAVKCDLALIATTIAGYEPVTVLVSAADRAQARQLIPVGRSRYPIEFIEFDTDDLWLRDTGPTFVRNRRGVTAAVDFNFNGWGRKQAHARDAQVAAFVSDRAGVPRVTTDLVLEGGCFEVDGDGTAIMTRSCILNDNRNPGRSQAAVESELKRLLGLEKIIWLDGVAGQDITDGHTDFYARFVRPGEVIASRDTYERSPDYAVTRDNIALLNRSRDARNRPLTLHVVDTPDSVNERFGVAEFAAGYVGYYLCNGAVIAQRFGDRLADSAARSLLQRLYPERVVEQLSIDGIASGGGSIHCATQQQIAPH